MKISNEVKIGAIAVASIAILILGFNFLKGKKLFSDDTLLIAKYNNIQGLQPSNPIMINGMQVGSVYRIVPDKYMRDITVELNISKNISIPVNSIGLIRSNPLGATTIDIKLGDAAQYLKNKDTLPTEASSGLFSEALKKVDPVLFEVRKAVTSIDTLVGKFNSTLDPAAKNNIGATLQNMNAITSSMVGTSAALNRLIADQQGALNQSLKNVNSITANLAEQNSKIANIMNNLNKTSTTISELELKQTMAKLDAAAENMKQLSAKLNSNSGSLGMLMNDTRLYNNLAATGNKLNLLVDDIRMNPKRYINVSVFGRKNTAQPIMVPLPDTIHAPYYIEKVKVEAP